jgi:hypothetical protein
MESKAALITVSVLTSLVILAILIIALHKTDVLVGSSAKLFAGTPTAFKRPYDTLDQASATRPDDQLETITSSKQKRTTRQNAGGKHMMPLDTINYEDNMEPATSTHFSALNTIDVGDSNQILAL